jgi:hypothetical protein
MQKNAHQNSEHQINKGPFGKELEKISVCHPKIMNISSKIGRFGE